MHSKVYLPTIYTVPTMKNENGSSVMTLNDVMREITEALAPYSHTFKLAKFPNLRTLKASVSLYNHGEYFHPRTLEFFGISRITLARPSVTVETADIGFYTDDVKTHKVILWVWDSVILSLKPISLTRFPSRGDALVFSHYVQKILDGFYAEDGYPSPLGAADSAVSAVQLGTLQLGTE
jgi:hypothetical protein